MIVLVIAAMAFAIVQPIKVLPRLRPAPGYALTDQDGTRFTSEDARGTITLYTFMPLGCGDACARAIATMREVRERAATEIDLGGVQLRLVTVVLDTDVPSDRLAAAATAAGEGGDSAALPEWVWLTGTPAQIDNVVELGFRRSADPADFSPTYAIVDGWGTIRGEYRYSTLLDDADKLLRHLDVLGGELRHPGGISSFAYDAAHAFQCYP